MKQLLLMFVLLISSITNAQTFVFSCEPQAVLDGTRAERLLYVQTLATGNTTITRSDDTEYNGNPIEGDIFTISFVGANSTDYSVTHRPFGVGPTFLNYGKIEDISIQHALTPFYSAMSSYVDDAQDAYDLNALRITRFNEITAITGGANGAAGITIEFYS